MTPEIVEYHRVMLLVGMHDRFYRAFDDALESEEPLSDLMLSLCNCISDVEQVLPILRAYTLNHSIDEKAVCDLILEDLRGRYLAGEMSRADVADILYRIVKNQQKFWEEPWESLTVMYYDLELWEDGMICEEVFNQCFDTWFFRGEHLHAWDLQRQFDNEKKSFQ